GGGLRRVLGAGGGAQGGQLALEAARQRDRLRRVRADETRRTSDPVREHVSLDDARRLGAARHREREAALGVRERHEHVVLAAATLDDRAIAVELVRAELDPNRT